MGIYVKKPVEIDAIQWDGENIEAISAFISDNDVFHIDVQSEIICIKTLEGDIFARKGDWVIRGIKGEFYPCKPDIFEATYDLVVN